MSQQYFFLFGRFLSSCWLVVGVVVVVAGVVVIGGNVGC